MVPGQWRSKTDPTLQSTGQNKQRPTSGRFGDINLLSGASPIRAGGGVSSDPQVGGLAT